MNQPTKSSDVRSEALRLLSGGVYVLTACTSDSLHAATVTWAGQVSFQPPLVMVAVRRNSRLAGAVRQAHRFALNILGADQAGLAERFFQHWTASPEAVAAMGAPFRLAAGNCPLLAGTLAWLECRVAAEAPSPGDHALLLGEVTAAGVRRAGPPLVLGDTPWSYGGVGE
jgi:flavin reductase (DIM6/NTAB) family NADH-FMN oxidoreductase RutF